MIQIVIALLLLHIAATILVWWRVPYLLKKVSVLLTLNETTTKLQTAEITHNVKTIIQGPK